MNNFKIVIRDKEDMELRTLYTSGNIEYINSFATSETSKTSKAKYFNIYAI